MAETRQSLFPARLGDISLLQLDSVEISTNQTKAIKIPGGSIDPWAIITAYADPVVRLTTNDLDSLLGEQTPKVDLLNGYAVDTAAGTPTLSSLFQYQQRSDGGTFDASNNDIAITSTKGFAYIEEISAMQDDPEGARATVQYAALSPTGQSSPLSIAGAHTLVGTPTFNSAFFLGPVLVGTVGSGTKIEGITGVTVRPGIDYRVKRSSGAPYATIGSIHERRPEIRLKCADLGAVYTNLASFFGQAISGTSTQIACYFQCGQHASTRVAYATTSHIRVLAATGEWSPDSYSVSGSDDVNAEIVIRPTSMSYARTVAIA